ncbi:MAG: oxidoreductase [uncultured bacterium]|nr:MAG: oxidoreductase [uncultured bacterium]OGT24631.1 MAG: aldo/keto reductase [Gammaproteobacteria bacterium RIFCSPHIGHO2_12_38_15]OGT67430.1 MAG: aldo/keto reductase [Gammaproteobacteria bacterium RIFCSPLOWO2_02_FULL_38_11]
MELRFLGSTSLRVSPLGLGTVKMGRNQNVKYPQAFDLPTDKQIQILLNLCLELGINLIDTAPAYGNSELRIGKLLPSPRQQWVILSKAGEEFIDGQSHYDFSKNAITESVKRSLKRLNTDYLDCVLIHSNGEDEKIILEDNALDTLASLKKEGYIRALGMSTKTVEGGLLALQHSDVVMACYHPLYTAEKPVLDKAQQLHKGILIKKALLSGHLEKKKESNPIHANLDFIFKHPAISSVIIGTINPQHLRENATHLR